MSDVGWDRIKAAFEAAIAAPAEDRAAILERECGEDAELRQEVESLLDARTRALVRTAGAARALVDAAATVPTLEQAGSQIGRYRLLQPIGEGGFGIVWMAEQREPVKRRVALKIIKLGMDTRQVIARFEAERQALAMMDHPNIAKVLDAGATETGRPYFVMEYIRGVPICEYCDAADLDTKGRLELFGCVCHAIQHAHMKGVIHRDIKPSNVLVTMHDGVPVAKVIDFGIAKATGIELTQRTLFTEHRQLIGTPAYMSPEQAELSALDIDTRSDIYSLGVLLYELLTGTTPFPNDELLGKGYAEMMRIIREVEPPKPSTRLSSLGATGLRLAPKRRAGDTKRLGVLVGGDLDWIAMKCLEKDRTRRYETAAGLALDVQRYLADEPVAACPPSARYRFRKFVRRNRGAVVVSAAIVLLLVAGMAGTTYGLLRAEHRRAEAERAEEETLASYRASMDDAIIQLIGSKPELGPSERAYLEAALGRWKAFAERQGSDQRSRAIRAEGHLRAASLWSRLDRGSEARAASEAARSQFGALAREFPETPSYRLNLAIASMSLATVLSGSGERGAARSEMETARDLLQQLLDASPGVPAYQAELAKVHHNLGTLLFAIGENVGARNEYEAACALSEKLVAALPAVPGHMERLANTHHNLGVLLGSSGQREAARREYETARDLFATLVSKVPANPEYRQGLGSSSGSLGLVLCNLGQPEAGCVELEKARDVQQKLVGDFPGVGRYRQSLARTRTNLGVVLDRQGRLDEARVECQAACDLCGELAAAFPNVPDYQRTLAAAHSRLGTLLAKRGQLEAARSEHELACGIRESLVAAQSEVPQLQIELGMSYGNLGLVARDDGKPAESVQWYDLAIRTVAPIHERDPRGVLVTEALRDSHAGRAASYDVLDRFEEAVRDWERAIELDPTQEEPSYRESLAASRRRAEASGSKPAAAGSAGPKQQ